MKTLLYCLTAVCLMGGSRLAAQSVTYTNLIRQVQYPSLVDWRVPVDSSGQQLSALAIDPGGASFELWTTANTSPPTDYLLSSNYVSSYMPVATIAIRSEDTTSTIPRTRADRPFYVDVTLTGLLSGATDPPASKSVTFNHYSQSYGAGGTGVGINRTQASLLTQASLATSGTQTFTYPITVVPGADRSKVRGEERFSAYSLPDPIAPVSLLSSQYIQIWPVADGSITGITPNQAIRYSLPQLTFTLNDLYPNSTTYAQVYQGPAQLGVTGTIVPGSALVVNDSVPNSRVLVVNKYDSVFTADGVWTLELLTETPFGIDRLAYVTFSLDRTMKMNGSFSTIE